MYVFSILRPKHFRLCVVVKNRRAFVLELPSMQVVREVALPKYEHVNYLPHSNTHSFFFLQQSEEHSSLMLVDIATVQPFRFFRLPGPAEQCCVGDMFIYLKSVWCIYLLHIEPQSKNFRWIAKKFRRIFLTRPNSSNVVTLKIIII